MRRLECVRPSRGCLHPWCSFPSFPRPRPEKAGCSSQGSQPTGSPPEANPRLKVVRIARPILSGLLPRLKHRVWDEISQVRRGSRDVVQDRTVENRGLRCRRRRRLLWRVLPLERARSWSGGVLQEKLIVRRERVVAVRILPEGDSLSFHSHSVLCAWGDNCCMRKGCLLFCITMIWYDASDLGLKLPRSSPSMVFDSQQRRLNIFRAKLSSFCRTPHEYAFPNYVHVGSVWWPESKP